MHCLFVKSEVMFDFLEKINISRNRIFQHFEYTWTTYHTHGLANQLLSTWAWISVGCTCSFLCSWFRLVQLVHLCVNVLCMYCVCIFTVLHLDDIAIYYLSLIPFSKRGINHIPGAQELRKHGVCVCVCVCCNAYCSFFFFSHVPKKRN